MTPEQVTLIQDSFSKVVPIADTAADIFYARLFDLDAKLKPLFKNDMEEQGAKLMATLGIVVNGLTNLADIVPAVQDLGRRHVGYGVKDEHYDTVGAALIWTLSKGLGDAFTDDVKEAWITAYGILAATMKDAASEMAA